MPQDACLDTQEVTCVAACVSSFVPEITLFFVEGKGIATGSRVFWCYEHPSKQNRLK